MSFLETILTQCNVNPNGLIKNQLDYVTMQLMDRLGDNNKATKDKAEQLSLMLSTHDLGGTGFMINHIVKA